MSDLADVTTDELYEELESRFDFAVFIGEGPTKQSVEGSFVYCQWKGGLIAAWGLLRYADLIFVDRRHATYGDLDAGSSPMG